MKIIVVGCGSIGRRHMQNLQTLGHAPLGVDLNEEYRRWAEENLNVKAYPSLKEAAAAEKAEACWVCTPPSSHISIAKEAIGLGLHVFLEKPLASALEGVEELISQAKKKKLKLAVGYNLRFSKGVMKLKELLDSGAIGKPLSARVVVAQYLPDWRPWQDYRKSYTATKSMGGGMILDGSHEIDYIRWLLGKAVRVTCVASKVSSLEVDVEDNADIIYEFASGSVANIHLDFVRRDPKRGCEIIGEKGTLELVFGDSITLYDAGKKEKKVFDVKDDHNNTYIRETEDFITAINKGRSPLVTAEEGETTLRLALGAKRAAQEGKTISLA